MSTIEIEDNVDANILRRSKEKPQPESISSIQPQSTVPVVPVISGYEYKMDHKYRGKAIIFNHYKFDNVAMGVRSGTELDCNRLEKVLKKCYGFDVLICQDYKYGKIYDTLQKAANEDYTDCDCILLAVMSHGERGQLYAKDVLYRIEDLWMPFTQCPTLVGKPKIFFIQACRGEQLDSGHTVYIDSVKLATIPTMADILVMYSTFDGYYSFRSSTRGSWFIQRLCDELENCYNHNRDMLQILTLVNRQVALKESSFNPFKKEFHEKKQVGSIVSSLTRLLYITRKDKGMRKEEEEESCEMEEDVY